MDQKLMQGMLLAAVFCLIFAVTMTWVDIAAYGEYRTVVAAGVPGAGGIPPTGTAPAAEEVDLLRFAPSGSIGYVKIDFQRIMSSPVVSSMLAEGPPLPVDAAKLGSMAVFFGAPAQPMAPGQQPPWCGVMTTRGTTLEELRDELAAEGTEVTVSGLNAYRLEQGLPVQMPMMPAQQQAAFIAPVEEALLLLAESQAELTKIAAVYEGGQAADLADLRQMAQAFLRDSVSGAVRVPPDMLSAAAEDPEMPAWLANVQGGAFGVSMQAGLELRGLLRLGDSASAQEAAGKATTAVAGFKQQLAEPGQAQDLMLMMFQPVLLPVVNNLTFSADGPDVNARLRLTEQDLQSMVDFAEQMQQQMQQMQGGMMGPPGGGGTSSMGGGR